VTWSTFFAAPEDFVPLIERVLQLDGAQLLEVYSRVGERVRAFTLSGDVVDALQLGVDPTGNSLAAHCALWVPKVMPPPTRKQIELRAGGWRESVEGCGLFWLQTGGLHDQSITESRFGWFTEAAARSKCTVAPGPDAVRWNEHAVVVKQLKAALRSLTVTRAERFPVLRKAAALHAEGYRLLYGPGLKREIA
jgi:hypothetical protein